jgi:hypothetical protein
MLRKKEQNGTHKKERINTVYKKGLCRTKKQHSLASLLVRLQKVRLKKGQLFGDFGGLKRARENNLHRGGITAILTATVTATAIVLDDAR